MASAWDNLNGDFESRLRSLIAESGGRVTLVSGYRSEARQQELWANAIAKYGSAEAARKWVAPPGKSNHQHGTAMDLGGDLALAHALAPKYGLTFPMSHEPWHIEPEGLRSHPDAYTTPPDDMAMDETGEPKEDHVDKLHGLFASIFDEQSTSAMGERETPSAGEFDGSLVKETSTLGADMSGETQQQGVSTDIKEDALTATGAQ